MAKLIGIFREKSHSPNREFDDFEILRLTAEHCTDLGHEVRLFQPEEFLKKNSNGSAGFPDLIFMMCEEPEILGVLKKFETEGSRIVNSIHGILNTYRHQTIPLLETFNVPFPKSEFVSTQPSGLVQSKELLENVWIKRGDFHNTQSGDVVHAHSPEEIRFTLKALCERGVQTALLQKHIEGDLIKFYGIGGESGTSHWFRWFYHKDQALKNIPFSQNELQRMIRNASQALNLEVYGGDAIVDFSGKIVLIDLNAWPSFALFRADASREIANYMASLL